MANVIKIKKGLDINLKGKASEALLNGGKSATYAIVPDSFSGITPKVVAKVGDKVKAGSVLMTDKNRPEIKFVSPVSGEVTAVNRGEKRKVLSIVVKPDAQQEYEDFGKKNVASLSAEQVKESLLNGGMWPFIKQRPYDIVATPTDSPRDIFVTAFNSAPLAPNFDFIVKGEEANLQTGLDALAKLTKGKVYVGVKAGSALNLSGVEVVAFDGPHPAGNVGVQINHIKPVNKGEVVWTVNATDVILMGRLFNKGVADFTRLVAITGSETTERGYIKAIAGCTIESLLSGGEFEKRAFIVALMTNCMREADFHLIEAYLPRVRFGEYYTDMAATWRRPRNRSSTISTCLIFTGKASKISSTTKRLRAACAR